MNQTQIIIVAIVIVVLAIDFVLYLKKGDDATISRTLLELSKNWPIIPFLIGVVAGHVFWTNCGV